jgi:hypothetical protein
MLWKIEDNTWKVLNVKESFEKEDKKRNHINNKKLTLSTMA